jgi:hypothetical protein
MLMNDPSIVSNKSQTAQHTEDGTGGKSLLKLFLYPGLIMISVVMAVILVTKGMQFFPFLYSNF